MPALTNQQHEKFCDEYCRTHKLEQSVIAAGYKSKTNAQGSTSASVRAAQLMRRPDIQARIAEISERSARRLEISRDRWLAELACIAFNDPRKFFDESGHTVDIPKLKRSVAAALGGFEVTENVIGQGRNRQIIGGTKKFKLIDKHGALVTIGKHLGFLVERHEHTGAGGGPIELTAVRDIKDGLLTRIARLTADGSGETVYRKPDAERGAGPQS